MRIAAIDPGTVETGIAVVEFGPAPRLLHSCTVARADRTAPLLPYLEMVYDNVRGYLTRDAVDLVAIEDVVAPTLRMERAAYKPGPILETAIVAGFCLSFHHTTILVAPDGNGAGPLGNYPTELVSDRERQHPNWRIRLGSDSHGHLRHERSAYDVARRGYQLRAHAHTLTPKPTPAQVRLERLAQ